MTTSIRPTPLASRAVLLLLVSLWAKTSLAATAVVEDVRVWPAPDHTRVVLDLSAPIKHRHFALKNPDRVVIDLQGTKLAVKLSSLDLTGTPLAKVRGAPRGNDVYRLVLDTKTVLRPNIFSLSANAQYGNRLVIDLHDPNAKPVALEASTRENEKRDLIIAIDAGHGGEDPGALGPRRVREKHVVMDIARKMQVLINQTPGYRAVMVRDGDYYVGLGKRRELARRHRADLFLSVHADAFKDKKVSGASVYTLSQSGASSTEAKFLADSENKADRVGGVELSDKGGMLARVLLEMSMDGTLTASARVALDILGELGSVSKLHKRSVEHASFAVLKSPDIPSVLIETGFISNPHEAKRLSSKQHQQQIADAVVRGVKQYFSEYAPAGTLVYRENHNQRRAAEKQVLAKAVVPMASSYKVRSGDTLLELALRHDVSLTQLRRYNSLKNDKIRVGQVIRIPPNR